MVNPGLERRIRCRLPGKRSPESGGLTTSSNGYNSVGEAVSPNRTREVTVRKFGLEVEYGGSRPAVVDALRVAGLSSLTHEHGYAGHSSTEWVVKYDASVSDGGELVSPPLDFDDPEQRAQVNKAIAAVRSTGARTSSKAGIHIHVDCSDLTAEQVASVARCFTKFEDIIYRLASSGWRNMRPEAWNYCRPLDEAQVAAIARAKTDVALRRAYLQRHDVGSVSHSDPARYRGINLQSYFYRGTVEFRVFNSSLNADRIQAYIAICVALVEDARRGNKRSVTKAYRIGGMLAGTTDAARAYHRFQQVMRYEAGMSLEDYKLMNKCWKDSLPQRPMATRSW